MLVLGVLACTLVAKRTSLMQLKEPQSKSDTTKKPPRKLPPAKRKLLVIINGESNSGGYALNSEAAVGRTCCASR